MNTNKLSRGILTQAGKHFGVSRQAIKKRLYVSFDPKTIDFVLNLDKKIKNKKEKARIKLESINV